MADQARGKLDVLIENLHEVKCMSDKGIRVRTHPTPTTTTLPPQCSVDGGFVFCKAGANNLQAPVPRSWLCLAHRWPLYCSNGHTAPGVLCCSLRGACRRGQHPRMALSPH